MSHTVIQVENLSKMYRLGVREQYYALRDVMMDWVRSPARWLREGGRSPDSTNGHFWALRDISLEVKQGEMIGIVGHNGAGKSTLLKILSRITKPTSGIARMRGQVGSLLEVGTGFHPELTGRENIYLNGAILGMKKAEIERRFDEIVEFAEIEQFLDMPVKRYSSGMYMRLAFSIAAHLDPDILIIDEVLAVGDAAFQKKCLGKMDNVVHDGRTVLFVSHNMPALMSLCKQSILLDHGRLVAQGPTASIVQQYLGERSSMSIIPLEQRTDRKGDGSARIVSMRIESADSDPIIRSTSRLKFTLDYRSPAPVRRAQFYITILDQMDTGIYLLHNGYVGGLPEILPAEGRVVCITDPINLTAGRCSVHVEMIKGDVRADYIANAGYFDVESEDVFGSGKIPPREWAQAIIGHQWQFLEE